MISPVVGKILNVMLDLALASTDSDVKAKEYLAMRDELSDEMMSDLEEAHKKSLEDEEPKKDFPPTLWAKGDLERQMEIDKAVQEEEAGEDGLEEDNEPEGSTSDTSPESTD